MDRFSEIREVVRKYAYMKAKRKRMEEYKKILLVFLMKEIAAENKLSIVEQEKLAKKRPEYKQLLVEIRNTLVAETDFLWELNQFVVENEDYIATSLVDRQNNWNIHNM